MEQPEQPTPHIEVLWRPGCAYCERLRRGLRRAGVETTERNIWADPEAAARVRAATGGDETVPTVVIGDRALVNPSVAQVRAAAYRGPADGILGDPGPEPRTRALVWTVALLGVLWLALALWQPTTTWHLAPGLMAGAAPYLQAGATVSDPVTHRRRVLLTAVSGFTATAAAAVALGAAGLLRGPTLF
ncbi:MAG: glutaredoxin domain-containing protein, partial [Nocardioidaceae bacterium]